MSNEISIEQKTHDLTIAYMLYFLSKPAEPISFEDFVQSYENNYISYLSIVKRYD